jgi:hypothetical protein
MGTTTEVKQVDTGHLASDLATATRRNPVKWNSDLSAGTRLLSVHLNKQTIVEINYNHKISFTLTQPHGDNNRSKASRYGPSSP